MFSCAGCLGLRQATSAEVWYPALTPAELLYVRAVSDRCIHLSAAEPEGGQSHTGSGFTQLHHHHHIFLF